VLIRHSLAYLVARGLPGLANLFALMLYTRLLSADDYGRYALVIAGVSMAGVMLFQWQRVVVARWLPARETDPTRFLGEALGLFCLLAAIAATAGLAVALWWPDPVWQRLLAFAVPLLVAANWLELNLVVAAAQLAPARYGRLSTTKSLLALGLGGTLAWIGIGAYAPLFGLLAGCVLAVPLFGLSVWQGVRLGWPEHSALRVQLRFGLPLIATFGLDWVVASSDRLLIGWLMGVDAAGKYAVGYDLAQQSLGMLLAVVQVAAYPLVVRALEDSGHGAARARLRQNGELIVALALAGAAVLYTFTSELASVVVGPAFRSDTIELLPWIALAAAIGGIKAYHFDLAFHLGRRSEALVLTSAATALANVGLNLILIPRFGLLGAAWAAVMAFLLGLLLSGRLGRRAFPMPPAWQILLRAGGVAVAVALGGLVGKTAGGPREWQLICGLLGSAAAGVLVAYVIDLAGVRHGFRNWLRDWRARHPVS